MKEKYRNKDWLSRQREINLKNLETGKTGLQDKRKCCGP